jgi:hypothetical protein
MSWNNLGDFFERFKNITPPEASIEDYARQIINNEIQISRTTYTLSLKNNILWIKGLNGSEKSAIYSISGYILDLLAKRFGANKVTVIRFN